MGDSNWWFNRAGRVAPVSNPTSAVPNYGLTYDLATAPYDTPDQFDGVAAALTAFAGASAKGSATASTEDQSLWDHAKGVASHVGNAAAGSWGGAVQGSEWVNHNILQLDDKDIPENLSVHNEETEAEADRLGLQGWERAKFVGKNQAAASLGKLAQQPGAEQIFWGLEKVNEYSSTAMVASTLAEDDFGLIFKSSTWGDAHELTQDRHLNAGEAFAQIFYDKEVIQDEDRFNEIRQHNTVFNVGALAFNVVAAWRLDPNVLVGKGLGKSRDFYQGTLATNGRTREVQRDVLSAPDMETAKARAGEYTGLADKIRGLHAVSLYDRAQNLRATAQTMGYEQFKNLPAFNTTASGTVMAKLMQDVAHDDDAWNLVFRATIGDPDAIGELALKQGEVSDKIAAIEMKTMPRLQDDLERTEARYQKRLAEQGKPQDARIEITRFGDKWLDDEVSSLRDERDALDTHLATYATHDSWLQRTLPGLDEGGTLDSRTPNAVFGALERLGSNPSLRHTGGRVDVWQHDDYSPTSWVLRAPTKPFLKRVGVVSLNDVQDGGEALSSYLNQLDHIQGGTSHGARDKVLGDWAGSLSDMERKSIVERVERSAVVALGAKYGLSSTIMDKLGRHIQEQRGMAWAKFSDTNIYSPIPGKDGPGYASFVDESGNAQRVKMPVDPTQLANFHSLTNLTDLDRAIRENKDFLRSLDKDLASRNAAGIAWTKRHTMEFVDDIGTTFNSFWKPLALLSIRWPTRVVADESMRVMLLSGVLPHLSQWGRGAGNAVYNTGVVRPFEWWNGRKVQTGSLAEESLRSGARNDFDAYDYRAITNPTGVVPLDEIDFGKIDGARYDKLNAQTAKRWQYLRKVEAHRANTREAKKVSPEMGDAVAAFTGPQRPAWATKWDERLNEISTGSVNRGFFFDPVTHKANNKGFAVSVYPGKLRTFERKPTARELNYWTEKNSDILAIPANRVAVWRDADTGRWHLDVVKTTKRREDAMQLAQKAEATEFYDVEDGFTRYLSEDFYGHFDSPFGKTEAAPMQAAAAVDKAPLSNPSGAAEVDAPQRRKVGFGSKKWRSRDGRVVEGEDVFGPDVDNANIYHSVISSRDAMRSLFGGYTKGLSVDRRSRPTTDYTTFDPAEDADGWAKAYADFANDHVRYSPFWQRMAEGQSDEQIYDWLMGTSEGRKIRQRIPTRGSNPGRWVSDTREIFDHLFPNERALEAVRTGEITADQALDLIPEAERMAIHGDALKLGLGSSPRQKMFSKVVGGVMDVLATMPTDALVRHPFAATVYNREMRNYLSSVPADKITNNVLLAAESTARAKAVHEVRRTLYNIADEREGVHMLRFISPFFQAQLEVLERWGRISMEKPETIAHLAQLLVGSQMIDTGLWQVTDREGNKAKGYSPDNMVVLQVTPTLRGLVDKIPGLKGSLDNAGDITIPTSSLNLITGGAEPKMAALPSLGPVVTIPASELYFNDRPELDGSALYRYMYPFGAPRGEGFTDRVTSALLPAWMKRAVSGETADFDDPAFVRRVSEIGTQQVYDWEAGGRQGKRPSEEDALEAAKAEYRLRAFSSFVLPAPVTPRSPFQFYIDQYRSYQEKYGNDPKVDADEKFYDDFGPNYYMFAQQATQSAGMAPTTEAKDLYDKNKSLVSRAPDLLGVLLGPGAAGEFSDAVYQWQLNTRVSPTSSEHIRERLSPTERISNSEIGRGWVEYGKLSSALDAELRNRQAAGGSAYLTASSNADLAAAKDANVKQIIERNPAWQDAFNSRSSGLGSWLGQAYDVAFDKSLDDRTDIQTLRAYLIGRAQLQDALVQRAQAKYDTTGVRGSDQLSYDPLGNPIGDNADLASSWGSWVTEAKASNPLFAEIYNRYLEGDDLSIYIPPEVSGG